MLDWARWTGPAGCSRTMLRFFSTVPPWATLLWVCFRQPLSCAAAGNLQVDDAVVVTTAGTLHVSRLVARHIKLKHGVSPLHAAHHAWREASLLDTFSCRCLPPSTFYRLRDST
jgi:hypothetical protein